MQMGLERLGWGAGRWPATGAHRADSGGVMDASRATCEQILLSHVETCYSVALQLTRSRVNARRLTRDVMTWAWHLHDDAITQLHFKSALLTQLRTVYLRRYSDHSKDAARGSRKNPPAKGGQMENVMEGVKPQTYQSLRAANVPKARYAVEVRGSCLHAEANDLFQVLELLDGLAGKAHVIDRATRSLVYEGTVSEVFAAINGNRGSA